MKSLVIWAVILISVLAYLNLKNTRKVSLVYFADLHGHFEEHPELFWSDKDSSKTELEVAGGVARLKHVLNDLRLNESVLFMDAGDTIQGSAEVALTSGEVAIPILNALNIDLAIPGNWEVVYGTKKFKEIASAVNFPFIASNIKEESTGELLFPPYMIKEVNGIRLGILGFTDPDVPVRQPPSFSYGFKYLGDEVLQGYIDELKKIKKVDVVVLLTHIGLPKAVHLAGKLKDVDVLLSSDTHERTYEPVIINNTWVVEPGAFGSFLGKLDLEINHWGELKKKWSLIELRSSLYPEETKMKELVAKVIAPLKEALEKPIGETAVDLVRYNVIETTLDAVLADALKDATKTEIALSNGFRFAYPLVKGQIIEKDLWSIYPINTHIKTGQITGKQLKDFYEKEIENVFSENPEKLFGGWLPRPSGISFDFKVNNPPLNRIVKMEINGKPIQLEKLYTLTTCQREGDPDSTMCRIPNAINTKILDFDAHEAVRRYLKKNWPLKSPDLERIRALDLPDTVRSQYYRK
jgi:2',3'-cyclic-nucleotide 2'-phosphodiesterase (5'-nucleotidase family)